MNFSHWSSKRIGLAVLIGASLVGTRPVRAQAPATQGNSSTTAQALLQDYTALPSTYRNLPYDVSQLVVATSLAEPMDELLGASLRPIDGVLRSQLAIPADRGLLVASLRADGPSAQVGLQQNDILLSLADKPLATADDLPKQLKATGDSAVSLNVLRAGKPVTLQVKPIYRVTLGPAAKPQTEFFIGVALEAVDDALRAQLGLPAGQGVVVNEVIKASPAEKAGIKKNDVALELGGKPVASREAFSHQVQENQNKQSTLKVLRGGKPMTIPITAAERKVETQALQEAAQLALLESLHSRLNVVQASNLLNLQQQDPGQRLDKLEQELKALREAVDKLNESAKQAKP
ncbi:MAG TPA: PDZ domain-containing protein [Gemmataceae bacterium]|nr:PDZ domain-containing protein [Gemmataceae bacterium]